LTRFFDVPYLRRMTPARAVALAFAAVVAVVAAGCEKADHETIDHWLKTQKGPEKLKKTLQEPSLDPDLSAHAAQNLIKQQKEGEVRAVLDTMSPDRRAAVAEKLAPRLWNLARIEGEMAVPTPTQIAAKDLLFELRKSATPETRQEIDRYLTDWYTSGYYEGRAKPGRYQGAAVIRALGPPAGEKLMAAANSVLAAPEQGGKRVLIGEELLLGLAVSGNPDAIKYVLDVFNMDRGDKELPGRAMTALYKAFAEPGGLFDVVDPAALVPNLDRLVEIAKDDTQSPQVTNDAIGLIRATGMPHCLAPLVSMVSHQHRDERYRWVGANNALKCGGAEAIAPVVEALPVDGAYDHEVVAGAVWGEIAKMSPRDKVLAEVRRLFDAKTWVAHWIAAESVVAMRSKDDLPRVKALTGDGTRIHGYFGDQSELPAKDQKPEPTLGQRAQELARELEKGAPAAP